ncbi:MAG: lycopene cyclase family protein [Sediminibacterium sp.]
MRSHYQYIIVGAGSAGLQLADALLNDPGLPAESLLIIEASTEHEEKTWCFWYEEKHPFQHLVKKQWSNIAFRADGTSVRAELPGLCYQYISSSDFYGYQLTKLRNDHRVDFLFDRVKSVHLYNGLPQVHAEKEAITANYVFHSHHLTTSPAAPTLWQHFLGWEITTDSDVFDPSTATLMDFSDAGSSEEVFFHYVLPYSARHALVECTFFSKEILGSAEYEKLLERYIESKWTNKYRIVNRETGKIPMTLALPSPFPLQSGIIPIGTAAGCIKASTGYSFTRVMRHTRQIMGYLKKESTQIVPPSTKRFLFYDRLFLSLIQKYPIQMSGIFAGLFKKNKIQRILSFLDESTRISEEIKIFSRLPKKHFLMVLFNPKK